MEVVLLPCSARPPKPPSFTLSIPNRFNKPNITLSSSSSSSTSFCSISSSSLSTRTRATSTTFTPLAPPTSTTSNDQNRHWIVHMEAPPEHVESKPQIIDYYVNALERILGCEKDAQMCIYDASCNSDFGFCCDIDVQTAHELARIPGVLSVRPDNFPSSADKDYNYSKVEANSSPSSYPVDSLLFPAGTAKHWLVRTDRPPSGALSKTQAVDYFAHILTQILGNEKDAQMCIYHVSWESNYGFCCDLDEESAKELADVPGVLGVHPDGNFGSDDKDYQGPVSNIKTKKIFVTGLSFYTSEKTLRAAFEGFGELVEVKIIMDKISKRSKGYAFIEYTTEEAANTALREMNGKIINGWMITVDVAKKNPPKYGRERSR